LNLYFANPPKQTKAEMNTIGDWERPASTFRFDWALGMLSMLGMLSARIGDVCPLPAASAGLLS
jgi:hypothetical protein